MKPRILLTGRYGQVGWELERTLPPIGEVFAFGRDELDLANLDQLREKVRLVKPDIIVNAAAYTAVDKAEDEPDLAMEVNGIAPGVLAEEAKKLDSLLVHYSTDYVFDGTKTTPYTEEDQPNPLNVYGKTKLAGERAIQATGCKHLIFRTSWVYGMRGKNFLLTILKLAKEREEIRVVDDQFGAPTWCREVSMATSRALAKGYGGKYRGGREERYGIFHFSAKGAATWYDFAEKIIELKNGKQYKVKQLIPIKTVEINLPAKRPLNSLLDVSLIKKWFDVDIKGWKIVLKNCLETGMDANDQEI